MGAASLLYDPGGRVVGAIESIRDITNSKRAEAALVASEQKFNKTFHLSPALVAISEPETGRFLDVNEQFENQLGYSRSEMIGKTAGELNIWKSPEDRSAMLAALREHGRVRNLEFPIQAKSGQIVEVLFSSEIIELNGRSVLLSMANDITEHKRAQDALKTHRRRLQALASELVVAEEAERRRIAEEIHDNIGQSLSISLLKIAALRQGDLCPAAVKDSLLDIANVVEKTVGDLRTMIFDLSSPVLYKMGLEEAIEEWLSEELGRKHKIRYGLTRENEPQPLDEKIKVLLFRAVREVLVNVLKHARASHVGVHIVWSPDRVRVAVEDNGVGFDPAEKMPLATRKGGFGLLSIRERLTYLGGSFEVHSQPSRGSRMVLTVPCRIMEFPFHGEPV